MSMTKKGNPLDKSQYIIDLGKQLFATKQAYVSIDCNLNGWTFKTGGNCIFNTGHHCTFKTGSYCTFKTGDYCTFDTGDYCTFTTDIYCTFKTGYHCTFTTYGDCTFKTGSYCTFKTDDCCTYEFGELCIFSLWDINSCKFKSCNGNSIILDRKGHEAYKLTKEFIQLQKVVNG